MKRLVSLALLCAAACVTTQPVEKGAPPDPRASLPVIAKKSTAGEQPFASFPTVLSSDPADPIVNIRVAFKSGSANDPGGKEGVAALTAILMREATEELSATQLADRLFPWAAEVGVQVDKDITVFVGRVHKDHAGAFVKTFLDVILHPRLDAQDFERLRTDHKDAIVNGLRNGNDEQLQREALEALIYDAGRVTGAPGGGSIHPYAHTALGTVAGLTSITLDDVRAYRATQLTRDRIVLGVSGGADPTISSRLIADLMTLPESASGGVVPVTPAAPAKSTLVIIEKPATGTGISVGFALPELSRTHPDYAAMKLAETWFGEHRNLIGHLFNSMREKRGLNYGDYAYIEHFDQEGWSTYESLNTTRRTQYFSMWIRPVENKNRLFALKQTLWELDAFAKNGIPDDESFARVQKFVMGYWKSKEQEPMRALGYRMDAVITGQPFDRNGLREKVRGLTRADVNAAIKRHLRADRLSVVVVTPDAQKLVDDINKKTSSPMQYAAKQDAALLAEDKLIDGFDMGIAADAIYVKKPADLFER